MVSMDKLAPSNAKTGLGVIPSCRCFAQKAASVHRFFLQAAVFEKSQKGQSPLSAWHLQQICLFDRAGKENICLNHAQSPRTWSKAPVKGRGPFTRDRVLSVACQSVPSCRAAGYLPAAKQRRLQHIMSRIGSIIWRPAQPHLQRNCFANKANRGPLVRANSNILSTI